VWLLIFLVIVDVCLGIELAIFAKVIICPSWSERPLIRGFTEKSWL
jgi:hypothetical protein